jgi:predicted transcriptional regulator
MTRKQITVKIHSQTERDLKEAEWRLDKQRQIIVDEAIAEYLAIRLPAARQEMELPALT